TPVFLHSSACSTFCQSCHFSVFKCINELIFCLVVIHVNEQNIKAGPSRDDLENGMAASGGDKVGQRCVGWDGKVRRRTNPRSGARRGANTSLSTLPAVSGGNSTTVMGRWLRPRLSTPSPAVRRLRTQLEL